MAMLPEAFAGLEFFAKDWCLATETERWDKRINCTMEEIQQFYDAVIPSAQEAIAYCDQYPLDDMPDEVVNLMHLLYSMCLISFAVECWRQPRIPDAGASYLQLLVEPGP